MTRATEPGAERRGRAGRRTMAAEDAHGGAFATSSVAVLRDAIAAARPTPGCGVAAAVALSVGLALVVKALRISDRQSSADATDLVARGKALMARLERLADDDADAFADYLALRHTDLDDDQDRIDAAEAAARTATAVPLALARDGLRVLVIAERAIPACRTMLHADVLGGALIAHGALRAALASLSADARALEDAAASDMAIAAGHGLSLRADACLRSVRLQLDPSATDPD
ncbi:MAG TPA: cyclodeaminase/cyclohydrolase family protein [Luteimonas sp.]|nr:cyclodeaminase/cyclohydrolase family protein [Luteimonas sp.]